MSEDLIAFAKQFAEGNMPANDFVDRFIDQWRIARDSGVVLSDPDDVSECLSTIFCLSDLHNPDEDREEYELNDKQLRRKVQETLSTHGFLGDLL